MTHIQTPADQKLAQALAESNEIQAAERREIEASEDERLEQIGKNIDESKARGVAVILEIGEQLGAAHDLLAGAGRDGEFRPWVKRRCGFSIRTSYKYLAVFRRFSSQKHARLAHFSNESLYLLANESCPQEVVNKALEMADRGEWVTLQEAKTLIREHKCCEIGGDDQPADAHRRVVRGDDLPIDDAPNDVLIIGDDARDDPSEDIDPTSGIELEQIQNAYAQYIEILLEAAAEPVRRQFHAWLRTRIK